MRIALVLTLVCLPCWVAAQDLEADENELREMHTQLIQAHLEGDVALWMSMEADSYVSVNRGQVTFPGLDERRERRAAYLKHATFSIYRDLRELIVRISDDGSLGWLIAEVEVQGTMPDEEGGRSTFHDIWAWIELYEKTEEGWRLTGNVSNRR